MISPELFVQALKKRHYRLFTGVPCSFFQSAINRVIDDPELKYVIVPNEGNALALAAGNCLAEGPAVVMIQNSGLGNLLNPLTSLNMIYRLPALVFVSGRGYGVPDEPQHEVIGKTGPALLDALGIAHEDLPAEPDQFESALDAAAARIARDRISFFFFVRKGTMASYEPEGKQAGPYRMSRMEAVRIIAGALSDDEYVIATTGMASRELFAVSDRERNFYMQGSMGHASSIALGIALARPAVKVVVLDGDGAVLMHMGILSAIGFYRPQNLYHVVLDNESYETTGCQETTSASTDLVRVALASGYRQAFEVKTAAGLRRRFSSILKRPGPIFLRVKINTLASADIPRISSKHSSAEIAEKFRAALLRPGGGS